MRHLNRVSRVSCNKLNKIIKTKREKDLRVTFTSDLNWKNHILKITVSVNRILGSLKKTFMSRDHTLWKNHFKICIEQK